LRQTEKRYVVTFFKTVTDDYGRDREIRQRTVEVGAADEGTAVQLGIRALCRAESLTDWSHHADRYEVKEKKGKS
jgi:hypothetical protein